MKLLRWLLFAIMIIIAILAFSAWLFFRYDPAQTMNVPVKEFTAQQYPDDPALLSKHDKEYS